MECLYKYNPTVQLRRKKLRVTSVHNEIISHIELVVQNIAKLWPVEFCLCLLLENVH